VISLRKLLPFAYFMFLCVFSLLLVFSPSATFNGAMRGLKLWALTLVPSLLPFIILSNILLHTNFIHIFGRLLNPIMRPIFHMSGNCAFVLALGFTSGFPMGAIAANALCEQNLCTNEEAARLIAFTNNSSPLFLLAAVPITMLQSPELGLLLLIAHYGANFLIGIFLGIFSRIKGEHPLILDYQQAPVSLPFIQIFTQAITLGVKSILNIGGFVVFFSVIIALGESIGLFDFCTSLLIPLIPLDPVSIKGVLFGLFEMTLGAETISQSSLNLLTKAMLISFTLAFSGLCIHAQVIGIAKNISVKTYLFCRGLQGILAAGFVYLLWPYQTSLSVFTPFLSSTQPDTIQGTLLLFLIVVLILFLSTVLYLLITAVPKHFRR